MVVICKYNCMQATYFSILFVIITTKDEVKVGCFITWPNQRVLDYGKPYLYHVTTQLADEMQSSSP